VLKKFLECQFGLVEMLSTQDVLDDEEIEGINILKDLDIKQSLKLLQTMFQISMRDKQDAFLDALRETNQSHLTNYFVNDEGKEGY